MGPVLLSLLKPVADLAANFTASLASTISTNLNATVSSRASQTTADTINTNTAQTAGRITAARASALDDMVTDVPGVQDTLSDTCSYVNDDGIGLNTIALAAQCANATITISSQDTWYTIAEESAGTSGVIEFLAVRSATTSTHSLDVRLTIDGVRVFYRTDMDINNASYCQVPVGTADGLADAPLVLGHVRFTDGFLFEVQNTNGTQNAVGYWRYYRTA